MLNYILKVKCIDLKYTDLSSTEVMAKNGWTFKNIGQTYTRSSLRSDRPECDSASWFGWKTSQHDGPGMISVTFVEFGKGTLTYGNCWGQDTVEVLFKGTIISTASVNELSKSVNFEFTEGSTLDIRTSGNGIVKLDSLDISCSGNYYIYSYISLSCSHL